jgi:hypothetical protein
MATTTWTDSLAYLGEHAVTLQSSATKELLASSDAEIAAQHLAILDLAAIESTAAVLQLIIDADNAETAALDAIENADLPGCGISP